MGTNEVSIINGVLNLSLGLCQKIRCLGQLCYRPRLKRHLFYQSLPFNLLHSINWSDLPDSKMTVMRDQPFEQTEKTMEELLAAQTEAATEVGGVRFQGLLAKLNVSDHFEGQSLGLMTKEESSQTLGMQKMELPSFNGLNARTWLARVQQYFLVDKILTAKKLELVVIAYRVHRCHSVNC